MAAHHPRAWKPTRSVAIASTLLAGASPALGATASGSNPFVSMWLPWMLVVLAPLALVWLWRHDWIRPGSPRPPAGSPIDPTPAALWAAGAMLIYLVQLLALGLAAAATGGLFPTPPSATESAEATRPLGALALPALASYAAAVLAGWGYCRWLRGQHATPTAKPAAPGVWARVGQGLVGIALTLPIVSAVSVAALWVYQLIAGAPADPIAHNLLRTIVDRIREPWAWGLIAAAVIGAPLVEELIYRRFVQTALVRATGRAWLSVLITSALFAAVHMGSVPPHALATLFTLSLALGLAFERTQNLTVPIVMHMAFNAINIVLAVWGANGGAG